MAYSDDLKKFNRLQKRFKRNLKWESEEERIRYNLSIPPREKLEWLWQMHEFMRLAYTKKRKAIFWKMRGIG